MVNMSRDIQTLLFNVSHLTITIVHGWLREPQMTKAVCQLVYQKPICWPPCNKRLNQKPTDAFENFFSSAKISMMLVTRPSNQGMRIENSISLTTCDVCRS